MQQYDVATVYRSSVYYPYHVRVQYVPYVTEKVTSLLP